MIKSNSATYDHSFVLYFFVFKTFFFESLSGLILLY